MYRRIVLLGLLGLALTAPVVASAQCASPATSTFPSAIVVCPSGDINASGRLLDNSGNPCIANQVFLSYSNNCSGSFWVAPWQPYPITSTTTDLAGNFSFGLWMGGCCTAGIAQIYDASGVILATIPVTNSPDLTADGVVNLSDVAVFASIFFGAPPLACGDFIFDGVLNLSDVVVLAQHIGH